jgi:uncharacterized membrane protein
VIPEGDEPDPTDRTWGVVLATIGIVGFGAFTIYYAHATFVSHRPMENGPGLLFMVASLFLLSCWLLHRFTRTRAESESARGMYYVAAVFAVGGVLALALWAFAGVDALHPAVAAIVAAIGAFLGARAKG